MNMMPSFKETSGKKKPILSQLFNLTSERVSFLKMIPVSKPALGVILQNVEKLFKHPEFFFCIGFHNEKKKSALCRDSIFFFQYL